MTVTGVRLAVIWGAIWRVSEKGRMPVREAGSEGGTPTPPRVAVMMRERPTGRPAAMASSKVEPALVSQTRTWRVAVLPGGRAAMVRVPPRQKPAAPPVPKGTMPGTGWRVAGEVPA